MTERTECSVIDVDSYLFITVKDKHLNLLLEGTGGVGGRLRSKSQTGQKECWDAGKKDKKSGTWGD